MSDLKAWRINDCDVYSGRNPEDAIAKAVADTGLPYEDVLDGEVHEVSRDTTVQVEDEPYKTTVGEILDGMSGPGLVCSTEW